MSEPKEVVVVTGSSGTIGFPVCELLDEGLGYEVVGFDREGPPHPPKSTDVVNVDLGSDESVRAGLRRVLEYHSARVASVIHLAAYYDFSGEDSPLYEKITVQGTERLLKGIREFGLEVEQFVFSSTMLVHAPCEPGEKITEDSPVVPKWAYPQSKVRTEELMKAERGDTPIVILRIAGVYDDYCHSIPLSHQMQRIYERNPMARVFPGDLSHGQTFLHLQDLVDLFPSVIDRRAQLPPECMFLIGEPETLSYGELQDELQRLLHGESEVLPTYEIPKSLAKMGTWVLDNLPIEEEPFIKPFMIDIADDHYEMDITRARTLLGWEPKRSLRETLPKMAAALRADPPGWYKEHKLNAPAWVESGVDRQVEGEGETV